MAQLSGNTCDIITLLPLGVICDSTNASTPTTSNGSIYLQITGGSSPYNVTWSNGGQGQSLINLKHGDYTATVVDYYGDYSATTTCTVGYDTFNLDWFENCSNPGTYIYYVSQEPSIFTSGLIYELSGRDGCWTSSGTTLWTGQTYTDSFATVKGGPFDDCETCLPDPEPTPVYPQYICLAKDTSPFTQYTFESGSTIYNGYPVWEETGSTNYKMVYLSNQAVWFMSGWTGNGTLQTNTKSSPPPTGAWLQLGSDITWTATVGVCTATPISIQLQLSNPTCANDKDGEIVVTASGGVPGYTYSLDGNFYQNGSTFTSLDQGSGTVYVKDSNGTVQTKTYTLSYQNPLRTYKASVFASTVTTVTNTNTKQVKKQTFTTVLGNNSDKPVSPDIVTYTVAIRYEATLWGTYNSSVSDMPLLITGITANATGGYSITSDSTAGPTVVVGVRTSGGQTQPTREIKFNKVYQIKYNPQNYTVGETLTFEVTNGGEIYAGGRNDLLQKVDTSIRYVSASNCTLVNTNPCSVAKNNLWQNNSYLQIVVQ